MTTAYHARPDSHIQVAIGSTYIQQQHVMQGQMVDS